MESDKLVTALELQAGTAIFPLFSTYVLTTKLVCPPLPARPLVRQALQQRMNEWHQYRLIRVEAPAGYGKTVLGGQLVQQVMAGMPQRVWPGFLWTKTTTNRFVF